MTQDIYAVLQRRRTKGETIEDFPTPPWAGRALIEHVIGDCWREDFAWEPACNRGYLVRGIRDYFTQVRLSDIVYYAGRFDTVRDFLEKGNDGADLTDWLITNPPFALAEQFALRAKDVARIGTALLVRTTFAESVKRYERLFKPYPPSIVAQFVERVPMVRGRCDPNASTATAYCWMVWMKGVTHTRFMWIPPCRRQLERPGDYCENPTP